MATAEKAPRSKVEHRAPEKPGDETGATVGHPPTTTGPRRLEPKHEFASESGHYGERDTEDAKAYKSSRDYHRPIVRKPRIEANRPTEHFGRLQ